MSLFKNKFARNQNWQRAIEKIGKEPDEGQRTQSLAKLAIPLKLSLEVPEYRHPQSDPHHAIEVHSVPNGLNLAPLRVDMAFDSHPFAICIVCLAILYAKPMEPWG